MKLKTIEIEGKTFAEVQDGKPVYLDGEKELSMDVPGMADKIKTLGSEAKGHREAKEAAEKALKAFEGIDDPEAALKALDTVSNLDNGKLMDAEKAAAERKSAVEAAVKEWKEKAETSDATAKEAKQALHQEKIGGSFARSQFIGEKLAVPAPMVEKTFGDHFTIEDGKIIAKDTNGNQIYSKANPGEPASFDEALEILVDQSPYKDNILKGRGHNGSGARGGEGGGSGGENTMTRAEYDALGPMERAGKIRSGIKVVDE